MTSLRVFTALALASILPVLVASASTLTVLHNFGGSPSDGTAPETGVVVDSGGALYGTTNAGGAQDCGVIFKLTPPPLGKTTWTEKILHVFNGFNVSDGIEPNGLIIDKTGALYGTTYGGTNLRSNVGGDGLIFKLTPPPSDEVAWTESLLYFFKNKADGGYPDAGVIMDANGALYGTTSAFGTAGDGDGVVFELTPAATGKLPWTESVLHSFNRLSGRNNGGEPAAGLIMDAGGALYGTTSVGGKYAAGVVFKLTPSQVGKSTWAESVLYNFQNSSENPGGYPISGLIMDKTGALYGTTQGGGASNAGVVFKLTPPAPGESVWAESVVHVFGLTAEDGETPTSGLVMDKSGALIGTTEYGAEGYGNGVIFKLKPPRTGKGVWTETVLYTLNNVAHPSGLIIDKSGTLYGTASGGGTYGAGGVFKLVP